MGNIVLFHRWDLQLGKVELFSRGHIFSKLRLEIGDGQSVSKAWAHPILPHCLEFWYFPYPTFSILLSFSQAVVSSHFCVIFIVLCKNSLYPVIPYCKASLFTIVCANHLKCSLTHCSYSWVIMPSLPFHITAIAILYRFWIPITLSYKMLWCLLCKALHMFIYSITLIDFF